MTRDFEERVRARLEEVSRPHGTHLIFLYGIVAGIVCTIVTTMVVSRTNGPAKKSLSTRQPRWRRWPSPSAT